MPSYRDIKSDLLGRIEAREWPPGGLIPGEEALSQSYGCARSTVNRALRELAETGVVERRRRAGTRVAEQGSRGGLVEIPVARIEIGRSGASYGYRLIDRRLAPATGGAGEPEVPPGTPLLHLICLHLADGTPWQLETRAISLAAVPEAAGVDFAALSPNEWLVREVPWTRSEHVFSAALPTPAERRHLGLAAGAPVFVTERRTWSAGAPVTAARLLHPGERFRLVCRDTRGP